MRLKILLFFAIMATSSTVNAQQVSAVYKISDLMSRIEKSDSVMVINFWATWCKPCIQEIPSFDSLAQNNKGVKVLLVSLDFAEDIQKKVNPFLKKNGVKAECVLLDEVNGNEFINKISAKWSGAIPATLFRSGEVKILVEKKMHLKEISEHIDQLQAK